MQAKNRALLGQLGDADLRPLRVFKSVVECGGMAAAELDLNIALSTISRHVGTWRPGSGWCCAGAGAAVFALTPEGEQVYQAALGLLSATDAFRSRLHDIHRRLGGDLHIALFEKTPRTRRPASRRRSRASSGRCPARGCIWHVGSIGTIERGVIDGQFHVGIIPEHRRSELLSYQALFDETMLLYAGQGHPWFGQRRPAGAGRICGGRPLAALGYHSPNMELAHRHRLERSATASDQEAVATFIPVGRFRGFPAGPLRRSLRAGRLMRAVAPEQLRYACRFLAIARQSPEPPRLTQAFHETLCAAHGVCG